MVGFSEAKEEGRSLLVDIGNTNLKWCWLQGGARTRIDHAPHRDSPTARLLDRIWRDSETPKQILIANVAAPALNIHIEDWVEKEWRCPIRVLQSERIFAGVTNAYRTPAQLGVDRWLTLVAARRFYPHDICIVDCGTAVTIDLLRRDGEHLGGQILPGFDLMRQSLLERTHIPRVDSDLSEIPLLGRDTRSAVAAASLFSVIALITYVMRQARSLMDSAPMLLLTGSDSERVASGLGRDTVVDLDLIMKGMAIYAEESKL
ncbi:MAG: type III pantothenate kinase [Gammaproteobacteria bacterium]|nr:type III pantothenate kinase [Gammaproteobacteria bacterium]